jgi:hypothetical protein
LSAAWQLVERDGGRLIVAHLQIADRPWSRLAGWQFRRRPPEGAGLLLVPCSSIHTFCVRFAMHIIGIDINARVTSVHASVEPWRAVWCAAGTHAVLELPAHGASPLAPGAILRLAVDQSGAEAPPARRSLRFLGA